MEQPGIFIQFSYNGNEIEGIEEFKKELEESYLCVGNSKWFPSCTSGGEFWLKVFFGGSFWDFAVAVIHTIIIDGVVRNGKKYILAPLIKALKNLNKSNENKWGLNMQTTSFLFDDIEVVIGGWQESSPEEIVTLFKQIGAAKADICSNGGIPLEKIELPCEPFKYGEFWCIDGCREPDCTIERCIWRLTYQDDAVCFYDSGKGCFIEQE